MVIVGLMFHRVLELFVCFLPAYHTLTLQTIGSVSGSTLYPSHSDGTWRTFSKYWLSKFLPNTKESH